MCEFKVGDLVMAKHDNGYMVTNNGWMGKVMAIDGNHMIVRGVANETEYTVKTDGFILLPEPVTITNPKKTNNY